MSEPVAPREPTVSVVPSARGPESATYVLEGEDHTLGNALRYAIMRDEAVLFCGYSVPPRACRVGKSVLPCAQLH